MLFKKTLVAIDLIESEMTKQSIDKAAALVKLSIAVFGRAILALTGIWCSDNQVAPMRRASSRSIFTRPYICRFTRLSFVICPSV